MGSSDFLSEAAINDNSEKCYLPCLMLPTIAQPRSHNYLPICPGIFGSLSHLGISTGFYATICIQLTVNIYIYYLLINTLNHLFLWSAVSRPCEVNISWCIRLLATLFQYLKTSLAMVHSLYLLYIKLNQLQSKIFIYFPN